MDSEQQLRYVFASIEGSYLAIKYPIDGQEGMKWYYNFKKNCSTVILALVEAKYRFIWASLGAPGNTHNSTYFHNTSLWNGISTGKILLNKAVILNGVEIPPIILCDSAFLLRLWTMKLHGFIKQCQNNCKRGI